MITGEQLSLLPNEPGVYLMKNAKGVVLYVGKANSIQKRVKSHCQRRDGQYASPFVEYVDQVDFIITDNDVEALLLEFNLIKKHHPPCNVMLKDDKRYPYIKVTANEGFPRAFITRSVEADGAEYFGPFPHVHYARRTLSALHEIFPIRTCKYESTKLLGIRPCLDYEIGRCCAPCGEVVTKEEYRNFADGIINFLRGEHDEVMERLQTKMQECSSQFLFEKAAFYRDIILAAEVFVKQQKMTQTTVENQDFIGFARVHDTACVAVIRRRGGRVVGSSRHFLREVSHADTPEMLNAFLEQFYLHNTDIPGEIYITATIGAGRIRTLEKCLSTFAGKNVHVKIPQRGVKHSMLLLADKNSRIGSEQRYRKLHGLKHGVSKDVIALQEALKLEILPLRIEGYDIAHTQGDETVGAMVVFYDGKPQKSSYRRFKIKTVGQVDDFASMREMLGRRFRHGEDDGEKESDEKKRFAEPPDLILIDGGKGQLNAVLEILDELDIRQFPVCSLAKREEEIYLPGVSQPIQLSRRNNGLRLLQQVRDEAHRFGNTYHAKLRGRKMKESTLRKIPGIGPAKEKQLLTHFGSLQKMREAGVEQLSALPGVTVALAESIVAALNQS